MKKNMIILLLGLCNSTCFSQIYAVGNGDGQASNCIIWDFGLTILPAELLSFDAACSDNKIKLQWSTPSDFNNNSFVIEQSADGIKFEFLSNSYTIETRNDQFLFRFIDENALAGKTYYRLKQTGGGGQIKYSRVVSAGCHTLVKTGISAYPNPTAGLLNIKTNMPGTSLILRNSVGQLLLRSHAKPVVTTIDLSHFPQGIYYIEIQTPGKSIYHRIVVNRN